MAWNNAVAQVSIRLAVSVPRAPMSCAPALVEWLRHRLAARIG
jgi:hypothetical protein